MRCVLVTALALATSAAAQEASVTACVAEAAQPADCVGRVVQRCLAERASETTVDIVQCAQLEIGAWDRMLNDEYGATMAAMRAADATGDIAHPDFGREDTLRQAQRAWIAFRDAECTAQYARWGGGSMREIAGVNCILDETAERALELRDMRQP